MESCLQYPPGGLKFAGKGKHRKGRTVSMEEKKKKVFDFSKLKKENFVVIFLIGMLLLVISLPVDNETKSFMETRSFIGTKGENTDKSGISDMESRIMEVSDGEGSSFFLSEAAGSSREIQEYRTSLEQTLEELLSTMEGAGKVKVMITLKASGESIVEKDTVSVRTSSTEVDSAGGSRNTADSSETEETVYTQGGSGSGAPFVRQVLYPQIEGVVVCAQGGGSATVNKNITEAIQALFGIEVHKIKVIKMSSR